MLHGAVVSRFVQLFPVWVVVSCATAVLYPPSLTWLIDYRLITPGLQLIMLGMGLTLQVADFARVVRMPRSVLFGVLLQYTIMPLVGWGVGHLFALPTPLAVGLILVCSCPGGTASNVIAYLARADVALSVSMTAISTLLAVLCTPLLVGWLAGDRVEVDVGGLFRTTGMVVLAPVAVGVLLRRYAARATHVILPYAPAIAVAVIVLIVGAIVGARRQTLLETGLRVIGAVTSAHALGFAFGFVLSRVAGQPQVAARTISIEVGMQNSGLGIVLAQAHFANPLTAVPSAISAVVHGLLGSALASVWSQRPPEVTPS